ncbi:MAG: hypothetical protein ACYTFG_15980, partial [Planctomycetota bacterium]
SALGGTSSYFLHFRPKAVEAKQTAVIEVHRSLKLVVGGVARAKWVIDYKVHSAPISSIEWALPKGWTISTPVKAPDLLTWRESNGRLEARFRSPKESSFRVEIGMEREAKPGEMKLPVIRDMNAHIQRGGAAVYVDKRFSPRLASMTDARIVDLPAMKDKRLVPFRGFQYSSPDPEVTIDLKPVAAKTRAFVRNLVRIEERQARVDSLVLLHVREGELFGLEIGLPEGYSADEISLLDAEGEWKLPAGGARLLLNFRKPLPAGQRFQVRASLRKAIETLEGEDREIPLPVLSVRGAEEEGVVGVSAPSNIRLASERLEGLDPLDLSTQMSMFRIRDRQMRLAYRYRRPGYSGALKFRRETPQVSLKSTVFYGLRGSTIFTAAHLEYKIRKAAVDHVSFLLPEGLDKGVMIQGAGVKPASQLLTPRGTLWTVPLQTRVIGSFDLFITFPVPLDEAKGVSLVVPWIRGAGVSSELGRVAVEASEEAKIDTEPKGLEEIDPEEIDIPSGFWTGGRALFAWKYSKPGWSLSMSVTRHETEDVARVIVEKLSGTVQVDPSGGETVRATFQVTESGLQDFRMTMPEGAELWSLTVDGTGVKPARSGNLLIVPLDPKGPTRRMITVVYRRPQNDISVFGKFATAYPEVVFDGNRVPVLESAMDVIVPEDFQLVAVAGSMTPLFSQPEARSILRRAYERYKGLAILLVVAVLLAVGLMTYSEAVNRFISDWVSPYKTAIRAMVGATGIVAVVILLMASLVSVFESGGDMAPSRAVESGMDEGRGRGYRYGGRKYKKARRGAPEPGLWGEDEPPIEDPVLKDSELSDHNETDFSEDYESSKGVEEELERDRFDHRTREKRKAGKRLRDEEKAPAKSAEKGRKNFEKEQKELQKQEDEFARLRDQLRQADEKLKRASKADAQDKAGDRPYKKSPPELPAKPAADPAARPNVPGPAEPAPRGEGAPARPGAGGGAGGGFAPR